MIRAEMEKWIKKIPDEAIERLRCCILSEFKKISRNDFKKEDIINNIISTFGYYNALKKAFNKYPWSKEFFKWYDALEWYDSDNFDGMIADRLKEE